MPAAQLVPHWPHPPGASLNDRPRPPDMAASDIDRGGRYDPATSELVEFPISAAPEESKVMSRPSAPPSSRDATMDLMRKSSIIGTPLQGAQRLTSPFAMTKTERPNLELQTHGSASSAFLPPP